jgi:protease YdgD
VFALAAGVLGLCICRAMAEDRRVIVDPKDPPWAAIVKVQTNTGSRCTGALIGPSTVITAAHCLYNPRTRDFLQPVSLHVLGGYERGGYRWHRLVSRFEIGEGWKSGTKAATADWARLQLAGEVPSTIAPLPVAERIPTPGTQVSLAGYNQDRAQLLLADLACHVLRTIMERNGGTLIVHDCAGTHGTSGAPLLVRHAGGWAVLGINVAAGRHANLAVGLSVLS